MTDLETCPTARVEETKRKIRVIDRLRAEETVPGKVVCVDGKSFTWHRIFGWVHGTLPGTVENNG